ncbi:MAG: hypothetical protein BGN91_04275 [Nitrobacter sp. 62-13]|nr:MAG: hypothetical protein BGN91_04275 [Nitrobacter sp. 62-13]
MRQAGKVLRFWISVLGLVIGLQSAGIAAGSEDSGTTDQAVQGESSPAAVPSKDAAAPASEPGDRPAAQASEAATKKEEVVPAEKEEVSPVRERDRDHSARSLHEMLILFLKGAAALTALVLFYKGLKRVFGPKQQSE